jgi:hypothetical protein
MNRPQTEKSFLLLFYKKAVLLFANKKKQKSAVRVRPHA